MKIISLQKKRNNIELLLDDGQKFTLDTRVVYDCGLRKSDELSEEKIILIQSQSDFYKTKDAAFRLISRRQHSISELKTKLLQKGYSKEIIENVLTWLKSKHFVDDYSFAKAFAEEMLTKKKFGINKVKAGLFKKGVDRKIIEEILSFTDSNHALENAFSLLNKKYKLIREREKDNKKIRYKLYSFLLSRGFSGEIITGAIRKLNLPEEYEA